MPTVLQKEQFEVAADRYFIAVDRGSGTVSQ